MYSPTESENTTALSDYYGDHEEERRIRVVDRFGMILQIFAARAKTHMARI